MAQDTSQQRRLAAIMFTDMVGYSALSQKNEALAIRDRRYSDDMYAWLDKAFEERSMGLVFISSVEWKPFRSDSRMIAFRKKFGLEP